MIDEEALQAHAEEMARQPWWVLMGQCECDHDMGIHTVQGNCVSYMDDEDDWCPCPMFNKKEGN